MKSKLTFHIMNWDPPDATLEAIERIQPRVLKVMDSGLRDDIIEQARRVMPSGALVVGRVYFRDPQPTVPTDDNLETFNPRAAAQETFDKMWQDVDKMGWRVDVWEGWNEYPVDENGPLQDRHWKKAKHFSDFTVELAEKFRQAGREYAAYSFSTGNPNHLQIWQALEPGLMASKYLALHEYIYPGENYEKPDFSMCTRHRDVYNALSPAARAHVKMLITECGADLHGMMGADGGGYKKNIGNEKYWDWLRQYDDILLADPYVLGATIYTYGATKDWVTYDISGSFAKLMANRIPQLSDAPEPAAPVIEPPVVTPVESEPPTGALNLARVRKLVQNAIAKLEAKDGAGARDILTLQVNPWFYTSAPANSTDLENAQAHTTARWYSEESTRRIEANKLTEALKLLRDNVLSWLTSEGPAKIGVLSFEAAAKGTPAKKKTAKKSTKQAAAKKSTAKKSTKPKLGMLSAESSSSKKSSAAKKKTGRSKTK